MGFVRTLAQLKASVRKRGQYEGSTDITDDILTESLNDALQETYDKILGKWDDYYLKVGASFPTVIGQDTYALAADFYKFRLVEVQINASRWRRLLPMSVDNMGLRTSSSLVAKDYRYRIATGNLILSPPPTTTSDNLRVSYLPLAPQLANDSDTVTFDIPVEQKLVLHITLRDLLQRQDLPTMEIDAKINQLEGGLRTSADGHDANEPFYLNPNGPMLDDREDGWWL